MNDFLGGPWAPAYAGATEPFGDEGGNPDSFANFFTSSQAGMTRLRLYFSAAFQAASTTRLRPAFLA